MPEVRVEDLARLAHHLALLGGVVVTVLEGLDLRQHVEGDLVRIDRRRGQALGLRSRLAPGRAAPRPRVGRCPRPTGRWTPRSARSRPNPGSASAPRPSASSSSSGWPRSRGGRPARSGLTSDTTSGTSSFIRQNDELSTTTAPASANRGAHSSLTAEPAEKSARSKPWIGVVAQRLDGERLLAPVDRAPGRALRGERHHLLGGEGALAHHAEHGRAHGAGGTYDRDPHQRHHRSVVALNVLVPDRIGAELEGGVQPANRGLDLLLANHARDLDR